jgi:hypothetical protein
MIEMLMAAFILSIGVLGLAALQVMVMKNSSVSKMRTTGIQVGQSILESVDTEARQQRLFRTQDLGGASVPGLSSYFLGAPVNGTYNIYGTPVNAASTDPLEKVSLFTTVTTGVQVTPGASATTGSTWQFQVDVSYNDTPTHSSIMTFRRTVAL